MKNKTQSHALVLSSINHPKLVLWGLVLISLLISIMMVKVKVDTDPENMLSKTEAVRVFHNQVKKEFNLYDVVVLGIVNEKDPNGVFNPNSLKHVQTLTEFVMQLKGDDPTKQVVARDVIAPGNTEIVEQAGEGQVSFDWLMKVAPDTIKGALAIRDKAMDNPLLKGTLVSEDGRALAIYIPLTSKDFSAEVRTKLLAKIKTLSNNGDKYYITGLPVAEDTFGQEMFIQMAISAPMAMVAIFLLMLLFFRQMRLVFVPMIIAMLSVLTTMGIFIGTGHTLHIMSSMIPIFLMPIAVVDSIHILSEFFDTYQVLKNRRETIIKVMNNLFRPMLYTSLTSAAGFISLAMTPIPPVQSFGIYVGMGIMLAWFFTVTLIPAYVMLMKEESLAGFGVAEKDAASSKHSLLSRWLTRVGQFTYQRAKLIILLTLALLIVAGYGITKIVVNDNPMNWFTKSHPIRIADKVLNRHFGGTYEAFLVLEGDSAALSSADQVRELELALSKIVPDSPVIMKDVVAIINGAASNTNDNKEMLQRISEQFATRMDASSDADYDKWADLLDGVDKFGQRSQIFKRPDVLRYIGRLQQSLLRTGEVGKSNSLTDVVKKIHQELFTSDPAHFVVPDTVNAVAQCLISFQNSHKPDDLWHLVTPDYKKVNIWVQLKNGDNRYMEDVVSKLNQFMAENPPPVKLTHRWAGLTYINVVWQDKMVKGMLKSFMGSFIIVLILMIILFRSFSWGLLAMIPLSVTIALIYGVVGLIGKDYDMPVAILSSLTLGMAVDFAIHFLQRTKAVFKKTGSWKLAAAEMFEEPARAITRNIIVIAVGFTPLLFAPLVPYQTVGVLLATIMAVSGIATMLILPAMLTIFQNKMFKATKTGRES